MARRVFFSYHFDQDAWRANQVRNSWVTKDRKAAGFFDAADQEEVKKSSDAAIRRWIDSQLEGTSVTAILIGEETADRDFVQYEMKKSFERGNGLVGIFIDDLKNKQGHTSLRGHNPLKDFMVDTDNRRVSLTELFPTYDWKWDNGSENIGDWVEEAAQTSTEIPNSWQNQLYHKTEMQNGNSLKSIGKGVVYGAGFVVGLKFIDEYLRQKGF